MEENKKISEEKVSEMMEEIENVGADENADEGKCEKKCKNDDASCKKGDGEKGKKCKKLEAEIEKLKGELDDSGKKYLTMLAEYDNFRRRSAKEKDDAYANAYIDVLEKVLPVLDNLERAAAYKDGESVAKGVELTLKGFADVLEKLGVKEIEASGAKFDPSVHNAVMHIEDEEHGEGEVVEVLQKGYTCGDKVLRYAMVKVAN